MRANCTAPQQPNGALRETQELSSPRSRKCVFFLRIDPGTVERDRLPRRLLIDRKDVFRPLWDSGFNDFKILRRHFRATGARRRRAVEAQAEIIRTMNAVSRRGISESRASANPSCTRAQIQTFQGVALPFPGGPALPPSRRRRPDGRRPGAATEQTTINSCTAFLIRVSMLRPRPFDCKLQQ